MPERADIPHGPAARLASMNSAITSASALCPPTRMFKRQKFPGRKTVIILLAWEPLWSACTSRCGARATRGGSPVAFLGGDLRHRRHTLAAIHGEGAGFPEVAAKRPSVTKAKPTRVLKGRIRLVRLGREPKSFAESTAQWRNRYPEELHQSPIAQNRQPLGLLAGRCGSIAELLGRFFHSQSDQRAIQKSCSASRSPDLSAV
jgi:hypothetical protein